MADSLDFVAENLAVRYEHTVEFSACTEAKVPIVDVMEAICGVGNLLLSGSVP